MSSPHPDLSLPMFHQNRGALGPDKEPLGDEDTDPGEGRAPPSPEEDESGPEPVPTVKLPANVLPDRDEEGP